MDYKNRTLHQVVRGSRFGLEYGREYPAGHALHFEGTSYYILKLWVLQERTYYIIRNHDGSPNYTVFAKKAQKSEGNSFFQNPIGFATPLLESAHLEITLPDLPKKYYLKLFPSK
jgi:hypothetical protein